MLALWTGQRQGDLLRFPWSCYDGAHIRLRQSKTGIRVVIPVGAPLKAALDATAKIKQSPLILINSEGKPWTAVGFRSSWRKACAGIGIVGVAFHDLRGTAVTRLALAGRTEAEIATITDHSLRDVRTIICGLAGASISGPGTVNEVARGANGELPSPTTTNGAQNAGWVSLASPLSAESVGGSGPR